MCLVKMIYLVSIINNFDGLMHLIQIVYLVGLFVFAILIIAAHNVDELIDLVCKYKKQLKLATIIFLAACFVSVFIPTKKEMYAMLAVSQSGELKLDETARKGIEMLNIKLDEISKNE